MCPVIVVLTPKAYRERSFGWLTPPTATAQLVMVQSLEPLALWRRPKFPDVAFSGGQAPGVKMMICIARFNVLLRGILGTRNRSQRSIAVSKLSCRRPPPPNDVAWRIVVSTRNQSLTQFTTIRDLPLGSRLSTGTGEASASEPHAPNP